MAIAGVLLALLFFSSLLGFAAGETSEERFSTHISPSDVDSGRHSGTLAPADLNTALIGEAGNYPLDSISDAASPVKGIIEAPWILCMQDDSRSDDAFQVDSFNSACPWLRSMVEDAPWLKDTLTVSGHSPEGTHSNAPSTPSGEFGMLSSAPWTRSDKNDKSGISREKGAPVSEMMLTRAPWTRSADDTSPPAVAGMLSGSPWIRSTDEASHPAAMGTLEGIDEAAGGMLSRAPWTRSTVNTFSSAVTEAGMLSAPWVRSMENGMLMSAPWTRTTIEGGMLLTAPWNCNFGSDVARGMLLTAPWNGNYGSDVARGMLLTAPWNGNYGSDVARGMLLTAPWNGNYGSDVARGSHFAVPATGMLFGAPWTRSDDVVPTNPVEGMLFSAPWVREAAAHATDSSLYNTVIAAATRLSVAAQATFAAAFAS